MNGGSGSINIVAGSGITINSSPNGEVRIDASVDLFELESEIRYLVDRFHHYETIFNFLSRESLLEEKYTELKAKGIEYENYVKEIFQSNYPEMEKYKKEYFDLVEQCHTMEKLKRNL